MGGWEFWIGAGWLDSEVRSERADGLLRATMG